MPPGRAVVPDAFEQFVEVVDVTLALALARRVLEALVVEGEALRQELREAGRRPLPELRPAVGADAIADGEDGGQVVVQQAPRDRARALGANLQVCLTRCRRVTVQGRKPRVWLRVELTA